MLLVWFVLDSLLSQCQCSTQEADRDSDDSGPRVTTLLNSHAPRNKLSACFRPSRRPTMTKNRHQAKECGFSSLYGRSGTESHASGKSSCLPNLIIVFSPPLSRIQRTVHRCSQWAAHAWLLCLGILVWQSDVDVPNCICVEVGSTHLPDTQL